MGVPNVPGVPPLSSYSPNNIVLLASDALSVLNAVLPPSWGVYKSGTSQPIFMPATVALMAAGGFIAAGAQVATAFNALASAASIFGTGSLLTSSGIPGIPTDIIPVPVSTIRFGYHAESPISNYQQEEGAFQSYDKIVLPPEIPLKVACGGSVLQRANFLNAIDTMRTSTGLVDIVTPEMAFVGYNLTRVGYERSSDSGVQLISVDLTFELVPQVSQSAAPSFSNTQQPGNAGTQSLGSAQAFPPPTLPNFNSVLLPTFSDLPSVVM